MIFCTNPLQDLALVSGHDGGNVVLYDRSQGRSVVDIFDPLWELRMPYWVLEISL